MKARLKKSKKVKRNVSKPKAQEEPKPHTWTDGGDKVLILRRCNPDMSSRNGFVYPARGIVECPDFEPHKNCGNGLHGWPWGMGLGEGADYCVVDDKWIVFAAAPEDIVGEIEDGLKCKVRRAEVVLCGSFAAAWAMINSGRHRLIEAMAKAVTSDVVNDKDDARIGSSGNDAQIGSSGNDARIGSSGNGARIGSSGNGARIGSSGYGARIGSSGYGARIGSSGYGAQIGSSGNGARIGSSGYGAQIGSSGYGARIGSSGNGAQIGSSGNDARIGSSGNGAWIGSSGYGAQIGSSGYGARIGSSGNDAQIKLSGERSTVACAGVSNRVRGVAGNSFALAWFDNSTNVVRYVTGVIGENGLKENTWYSVNTIGELVAEAK